MSGPLSQVGLPSGSVADASVEVGASATAGIAFSVRVERVGDSRAIEAGARELIVGAEYAYVRADAGCFAVAIGHENAKAETVVRQTARFAVVTTAPQTSAAIAPGGNPAEVEAEAS